MMRMSMAGKIYSIVVLLLAVAIVILGLGVYSMNSMTTTMHGVIRQANRLINIGNIDRIALERRIAVVSIIDSGVEAVMKNILDNDMKNIETRMEAEFVAYRSNFDSPPVQTQIQYEKDLRQLWGDYVKVSSEVGALAYANTNNKALAINTDMRGFLDNADATFENIGNLLLEEGKHLNLLHDAMIIRAELLRYRTLVLRFISEHDAAVAQTLLEEIRGIVTHTVEGTAKLAAELTPATGKPAASALAAQLKDGAARIEELIGLSLQDTNVKAAQMLAEKGVPTRNKLAEYAGMVIANGAGAMRSAETAADTLARTMLLTMGVVGAVGIVLAIIISYITISAIVKRLNATIASLGDSSSHVNSASAQISNSAQGLAEGSTEQAASLEQTSSALEEMASMTRQNADNATKTNETTQGNNKLIALGSDAVKNMSQAMAEISDSAEQINRIIKTIEDIAFQTNLLALNAAVEAARAGEAGKGFAVVADEVRNLAGRSAQAARDTTQLIHTTIERVRNGSEIASELDSSFKEIEDGSHTVARLIAEITSATNEQAQGVDQVNTAVAQMDKVTQQNAASAEEAASASEELSAEANNLNGMVRDLVSMVEGKADGNAAATKSGGGKDAARGGASKKKQAPGLETVAPTHANAAHSGVKQAAKVVSANDVIPLDENDDF